MLSNMYANQTSYVHHNSMMHTKLQWSKLLVITIKQVSQEMVNALRNSMLL